MDEHVTLFNGCHAHECTECKKEWRCGWKEDENIKEVICPSCGVRAGYRKLRERIK